MVSSTFTDLKEHRNALIQAVSKHDMHPVGMEFSDAKLTGDVVDASLGMVAKSAAYILIIGRKYGQTPECPKRNPEKLSVTELEYREAVRLNRPVLLFLMGDKHSRVESEIELDTDKRIKLAAFRELAKKSASDSAVNRVYGSFESLEELKEIIGAPRCPICSVTWNRNSLTSLHRPDSHHPRSQIRPRFTPSPTTLGPTSLSDAKPNSTPLAIGQTAPILADHDQAKHHALAAYTWAWADGEPYVHRYELTKTTELLNELGVPIPNLPLYDPAKDETFPWEADVRAAIEKLKAEKAAEASAESSEP
jgi:hypothetical protein